MSDASKFPTVRDLLPDLDSLISGLSHDLQTGVTSSGEHFAAKVKHFFSTEMIDCVESVVPGWRSMIDADRGITLVHVMTALSALSLHQPYLNATPAHQSVLHWAVLFHDVTKRSLSEHSDHTHAFRSAARFVQNLPAMGIVMPGEKLNALADWAKLVENAVIQKPEFASPVQDNKRLPKLLESLENLITHNTSAVLITKIVMLHHSINSLEEWPQANPLNEDEIKKYIDPELLSLLELMSLADNDGWELFKPDNCGRYRDMTRKVFAHLQSVT